MGKLSFAIEMVGGEQVMAQLERIVSLQSQIGSLAGKPMQSPLSGVTKKIGDESKALDMALSKMTKVDALAKSLTGGKWTMKMPWDDKQSQSEKEKQLSDWRSKMASMTPNVSISGSGSKSPSQDVLDRQAQVWEDSSQSMFKRLGEMNLGGSPLGKSAEDREKGIKKEAMEARRLDQMKADVRRKELDHARFMKDMTFSMMPLMNPGSLWGTLFGARQTFSAFMTDTGQEKIGKFGLKGVGGAGAAMGVWMAGLTAAGFALKGFTMAISFTAEEIKKAFQFAHTLYAKALSSGLTLGFEAKRSMTANVLGIQESEVFRSRQAASVMEQLKGSINGIAQDAPVLAYTSAQFKILQYDILAAASKLAANLAPALNGLIILLDKFTKAISALANSIIPAVEAMAMASGTSLGALITAEIEATKKTFRELSGIGNAATGTLGEPQTFMNQMPASSWEKMGLVIGGRFGDKALEYQRRTATGIEKLVSTMINQKPKNQGHYMGRSPFVTSY